MKCRVCNMILRQPVYNSNLKNHLIRQHSFKDKVIRFTTETSIESDEIAFLSLMSNHCLYSTSIVSTNFCHSFKYTLFILFVSPLQPIEEVYIEDGSTTETNGALSDDLFTDEFDDFSGQYDNAESEGKHSSLMHSSTSKTANRNETQQKNIPENERQQFSQFVYASLNQLSDRNALNAMFDIQGVLTKYRLASLSDNTDKCTLK